MTVAFWNYKYGSKEKDFLNSAHSRISQVDILCVVLQLNPRGRDLSMVCYGDKVGHLL